MDYAAPRDEDITQTYTLAQARYAQLGAYSGTLTVGGQTYDVQPDRFKGVRDHSWGVRPRMGIREPATGENAGLEELGFTWFEEPIADRDMKGLQQLCAALEIPILAPETLMHELEVSALCIQRAATDLIRANARHGTTAALKLAHCAQLQQSTIEFNGPGGLFGLVHAHVVCAVANTSYYEYFPRGSRHEIGREIGLLNPPVPVDGHIAPPSGPGWGAEWDWDYFEKKRVAIL